MGQGTESCGGYDVDCDDEDEYGDALADGVWIQKNGTSVSISSMTTKHLDGAIRVAGNAAKRATFSSDAELWEDWVEALESELYTRKREPIKPAVYVTPLAVKPTRGAKLTMRCHCGTDYQARSADVARGWGLSCSKRCASIRREYGRPAATEQTK